MSDIAIRVENLGKLYKIGSRERFYALRDRLNYTLTTPLRFARSKFKKLARLNVSEKQPSNLPAFKPVSDNNYIWALEDVSFEVKHGEVVGIIGRNGAGKSTLLKILSRITEPTKGYAEINGRVGSLLEVGTGFHPELTGRENIYLNGAILGMKKKEIARNFDEIVSFAEVEKFVDTPVKHYSTGMYLRLAFAVAAQLEPEILLVDEVLAVGDAAFQRKCLGKMSDVAKQGRTVLFVSHNMAAVQSLCANVILLNRGTVQSRGECQKVIGSYLNCTTGEISAVTDLRSHPNRFKGSIQILSSVTIKNSAGEPTTTFVPGDDLLLEFCLEPPYAINQPSLGVGIDNVSGLRIFSAITFFSKTNWDCLERTCKVRCTIPRISLAPGRYWMHLSVGNSYETLIDAIGPAASFDVEANDYFGTGRIPTASLGVILAQAKWEFF